MTIPISFRLVRAALSPLVFGVLLAAVPPPAARAQNSLPEAIAAPGTSVVLKVHAVGAQIYECVAGPTGGPAWQFREPIATLLSDGRTVGRHFAGPSWELPDGSLVVGKAVGRAPGETGDDIPWLKLEAATGHGSGQFAAVSLIQRINTKGGALAGACGKIGELVAVPYAGDYVFLRKGD
jgi:hypothetical protein